MQSLGQETSSEHMTDCPFPSATPLPFCHSPSCGGVCMVVVVVGVGEWAGACWSHMLGRLLPWHRPESQGHVAHDKCAYGQDSVTAWLFPNFCLTVQTLV